MFPQWAATRAYDGNLEDNPSPASYFLRAASHCLRMAPYVHCGTGGLRTMTLLGMR